MGIAEMKRATTMNNIFNEVETKDLWTVRYSSTLNKAVLLLWSLPGFQTVLSWQAMHVVCNVPCGLYFPSFRTWPTPSYLRI
jgi:hypothetical protein